MFSWIAPLFTTLFGSSSNGKGVISEVSDAVDRWIPSDATKHEQSIESLKAGDESQDSARRMEIRSHDSWFDILIDGLNRSVRPIITFWAMGILTGILPNPSNWDTIHPMMWNIIWTVITFWFGSRVLFKDIPTMIKGWRK